MKARLSPDLQSSFTIARGIAPCFAPRAIGVSGKFTRAGHDAFCTWGVRGGMSYWTSDLRKPSDFRSLEGLADVRANGRVLNLGAIARDLAHSNPGEKPPTFFNSATLNQSIIVKHNIRDNEKHLFARPQAVATKLILPIDPENLASGGATFMLGERQAPRILRDKMGLNRATGDAAVQRDLKILDILDSLATLDPFIVRERFAVDGVDLPDAFSAFHLHGDHALYEYMKSQLLPLVRLAMAGQQTNERALDRLLDEIFVESHNSKAEFLRQALRIEADKWPAALYVWKAALFYEYRARSFEPRWRRFMESLQNVKLYGFSNLAPAEVVLRLRVDLLDRALRTKGHLDRLLESFNQAFRQDLIGQGTPESFRDYLMTLNDKLYNFGVAYGVLEQIVGYWEYWFIARGTTSIPAEFFMDICRDLLNVAGPTQSARPIEIGIMQSAARF